MHSSELIAMLTDSRRRTLELTRDLSAEQLSVPLLEIINPPLWELGHIAWFQEKWILRHLRQQPPLRPDADSFWDSAAVAHEDRWTLPLPPLRQTLEYMREVLDRVIDRLGDKELSEQEAYFHWLPVMHEDMHGEAFAYTRQTLGYRAPVLSNPAPSHEPVAPEHPQATENPARGDVLVPGGLFVLGASPGTLFVFDNEKWAHERSVAPFQIARTAVTNAQFADFVEDCGYQRREFWSDDGWRWRAAEGAEHPLYWVRESGSKWTARHFDRSGPLAPGTPVIHVSWYEAEAYCRWAGRRLPFEVEWEMAASVSPDKSGKRPYPWGSETPAPHRANLDGRASGPVEVNAMAQGDSALGCRQMIGNVWEWTATDFQPYPGFVRDPYKEYSEPWFGSAYKVLRGGCWATRSRLIRNTWRNFYTKDRRDVFAGFRTCASTGSQ